MGPVERMWPVLSRLMKVHTVAYRATDGRIGHRLPRNPPVLLLDHVGARSGTKRTSPVGYVPDGDDLILVASWGGNPKHPAWFHNLGAHPDVAIQVRGEHRHVHARVADPEERARLWPKVVAAYAGYAGYQRRCEREIPVVVLEPAPAP
jgi:deazaflavin-dependent oxidoreductase (nitroreductase family)